MTGKPETIVLDSYALLCFLKDEAGADVVEEKIRYAQAGGCRLMMSLMNLGEVFYILLRARGEAFAVKQEAEIRRLPVDFVDTEWSLIREAAFIKAEMPMAFADCFAAAVAFREGASVLTGDSEFRMLERKLNVIWLAG